MKLTAVPGDTGAMHLRWLSGRIGTDLIDRVIITTFKSAYRCPGGIAGCQRHSLGHEESIASPRSENRVTAGQVRESAISIHVPEAMALVGRWYAQTDAFRDGVPPHISLLYPWRPAPLGIQDLRTLEGALDGMPSFELTLEQVKGFPGVVYLAPFPDGPIRQMMRRLAEAFPETPPYGGAFSDPAPHLTVFIGADETTLAAVARDVEAALERAPLVTFPVNEVVVDEEQTAHQWTVRHRIALGGL